MYLLTCRSSGEVLINPIFFQSADCELGFPHFAECVYVRLASSASLFALPADAVRLKFALIQSLDSHLADDIVHHSMQSPQRCPTQSSSTSSFDMVLDVLAPAPLAFLQVAGRKTCTPGNITYTASTYYLSSMRDSLTTAQFINKVSGRRPTLSRATYVYSLELTSDSRTPGRAARASSRRAAGSRNSS